MDENRIYTTVQGDMWDSIAYHFYGDVKSVYQLIDPVKHSRAAVCCRLLWYCGTDNASDHRMKSETLFSQKSKRRNPLYQMG